MYAVSLNIQLTFPSTVSFAFAVTFDAMTVVGGVGGVKVQLISSSFSLFS